MDLSDILKKTKNKNIEVKTIRKPPSIATEERPYSINEINNTNQTEKHNRKEQPVQINKVVNQDFEKSENELGTNRVQNREQTGNKPGTEMGTNWEQTGYKLGTNLEQTGNKPGTEIGTKLGTNWEQTGYKTGTKIIFRSLSGLQKKLIVFIYKQCQFSRSQVTDPLSLEYISEYLEIAENSVKTTIKRLIKKQYLLRAEFKAGRGGWSRYEIPELLFRELLQNETEQKLGTNWEQTGNKPGTELGTELGTMRSSSSSLDLYNKINKNTTTVEEQNSKFALTSDWEKLDIEPLIYIGFTMTHVKQVASQEKLTPEMLQNSIYFFAFDLEKNDKAKKINGSPLNFFMGIVRKGMTYSPPENYESPQEIAFRKYFEQKKTAEKKRQEMEKELFEIEFKDWLEKLTNEDVREIVPSETINAVSEKHRKILKHAFLVEPVLRAYFKNNEWPEYLITLKNVTS